MRTDVTITVTYLCTYTMMFLTIDSYYIDRELAIYMLKLFTVT